MILTDLQIAFDTTDQQILLQDMKYFGFCKNTITWFKSVSVNRNLK